MTTPSGRPQPPEVLLLQALLAAEHAAVHGYGVLGARLPEDRRERAQEADDAHQARRDELHALLLARGAPAPATLAAYDVRADDVPRAVALAVALEEGLGVRWRDLVAGTDDPSLRRLGTSALVETAVRAARWRGASRAVPPTVALPGAAAPGTPRTD